MDQTTPFQFPYPQCAPPLTKDASDIAHLRDLAVAVDTKMEELAVRADDLIITPDAGVMINTGTQVLSTPTDQMLMSAQEYDTSASGNLIDLANSRFIVQQTGMYVLTFAARATLGAGFRMNVRVDINGIITTPFGSSRGDVGVEAAIGFMYAQPLIEGDVVLFRWAGSSVAASVNGARAGIWRMM